VEAATFEGISEFSLDTSKAYPALEACRVYKSDEEIKILRYANKVSSNAHIEVMRSVKPGMTEFQVESLFLHAVYGKGQCRHVAYTCICAAGPSGALLHYPTNDKLVRDGQMMLLDMGGEYSCYASDITTSFPANGKFTEDQKAIYNAVLEANRAVQAAMKPGVNWVAMHELAYKVIAEHLLRIGICRGATAQELVDRDVVGLFMPHGLGHLMGHNVHDVGGYPAGSPARPTRIGFKSLRTARDLEERMVITVEPGIYFVKALLEPALANPEVSKYLDKAVLDRFMNFGGVRIEDDVLVTKTGVDNLTHVPRSVEDIEAVMAGGSWDIGAWNF
jgi:Xaa-Pro dipeptidase